MMRFRIIIEDATESEVKRLFGDSTRIAQKAVVEAADLTEKVEAAKEATEKLDKAKEEIDKKTSTKKPAKTTARPVKKEEPKPVSEEIDETFEKEEDPVDKTVKDMKEASEDDDLGLAEEEPSEPVHTKDELIKLVIKKRDAGKDIKTVIREKLKLGKISEIAEDDIDRAYSMFEAL